MPLPVGSLQARRERDWVVALYPAEVNIVEQRGSEGLEATRLMLAGARLAFGFRARSKGPGPTFGVLIGLSQ